MRGAMLTISLTLQRSRTFRTPVTRSKP